MISIWTYTFLQTNLEFWNSLNIELQMKNSQELYENIRILSEGSGMKWNRSFFNCIVVYFGTSLEMQQLLLRHFIFNRMG